MKKQTNIIHNPPSPDITKMNYFPPKMAQYICSYITELTQNEHCEMIFLLGWCKSHCSVCNFF